MVKRFPFALGWRPIGSSKRRWQLQDCVDVAEAARLGLFAGGGEILRLARPASRSSGFRTRFWPCSRKLALWPDVPVEVTGPDAIAGGRRCRAPLESGRRTRLHGRRAPATGEARWGRVAHGAHTLSSFAGAVRSRVELRSCACGCQPSPLHS